MYFLETLQVRAPHHVMGVCCIVFDIDGMLFEFFMNILNIEKNKIIFFFSIFNVFFAFHAISNIKKKIGVKKKSGGGGSSAPPPPPPDFFLDDFDDLFLILSHFTFYAIFKTLTKY